MARPTRRGARGTFQVRRVVPAALRGIVGKGELKVSLRTGNDAEARAAAAEKFAEFEAIIAAARAQHRGEAQRLTPREVSAMVGEWYRTEAAGIEAAPGDPARRHVELDVLTAERITDEDPGEVLPATEDRAVANALLRGRGVAPDPETLRLAARSVARARLAVAELAVRRAEGDWGADPIAAVLPPGRSGGLPRLPLRP